MTTKTVDEYLQLPYQIEVFRDNDPENSGWVARVAELPGCMTQGETFEELGEMIEDAMRLWIGTALEDGVKVPEPRSEEQYSGKFIVRVPKSLHRELVATAEREGVSLNMYVATVLGKAVGDSTFSAGAPFLYSLRASGQEATKSVRESTKAKRK